MKNIPCVGLCEFLFLCCFGDFNFGKKRRNTAYFLPNAFSTCSITHRFFGIPDGMKAEIFSTQSAGNEMTFCGV